MCLSGGCGEHNAVAIVPTSSPESLVHPGFWLTFLAQYILAAPVALYPHPVHRIKCENAKNCRTLWFFFSKNQTASLPSLSSYKKIIAIL